MSTVFTEKPGPGSCIIQEGEDYYSRDVGTIIAGAGITLAANTVLGKISAAGVVSAAQAAVAGNTGNGTLALANPAFTAGSDLGVYTVSCTTGGGAGVGKFRVENPDGDYVGEATVGTAFAGPVKFTISAGGTAFVEGDSFNVTLSQAAGASDGSYAIHDPAATDGSQVAAAILIYPVTGTDDAAILTRHAQVKSQLLVWKTGVNSNQKTAASAALKAAGIVVR